MASRPSILEWKKPISNLTLDQQNQNLQGCRQEPAFLIAMYANIWECLGWIFFFFWLHCIVHGILVHQPGSKPISPTLEGRFSTTGPAGRFWADLKGENVVILMEVRTH